MERRGGGEGKKRLSTKGARPSHPALHYNQTNAAGLVCPAAGYNFPGRQLFLTFPKTPAKFCIIAVQGKAMLFTRRLSLAVLLLLPLSGTARSATFVVDRTDDTNVSACSAAANDCTLRGAVTKANSTATTDVISFDTTIFATPRTISLGTLLDSLTADVAITGPGEDKLLVRTNSGAFAIFTMINVVKVSLSDLTFSNSLTGVGISGGGTLSIKDCTLNSNATGIRNQAGNVTASGCTLSRSSSYGLVNNGGTMTATNCTLSGNNNSASIYNYNNGTLTVEGCTLSGTTSSRTCSAIDRSAIP